MEKELGIGIVGSFLNYDYSFPFTPFAKLAAERANLEGQLRSAHSKIVSNNEEIAF